MSKRPATVEDLCVQGLALLQDVERTLMRVALKGEIHPEQRTDIVVKLNWLKSHVDRVK